MTGSQRVITSNHHNLKAVKISNLIQETRHHKAMMWPSIVLFSSFKVCMEYMFENLYSSFQVPLKNTGTWISNSSKKKNLKFRRMFLVHKLTQFEFRLFQRDSPMPEKASHASATGQEFGKRISTQMHNAAVITKADQRLEQRGPWCFWATPNMVACFQEQNFESFYPQQGASTVVLAYI